MTTLTPMSNIVDTCSTWNRTWKPCREDSHSPANYPLRKARVSGLFKNLVTEATTYGTPRLQACFHYHKEEEQDPQVTWKRLQEIIRQNKQGELTRLTNEPPSITGLVYLHPRRRDVRCIAEERKPHVFDM